MKFSINLDKIENVTHPTVFNIEAISKDAEYSRLPSSTTICITLPLFTVCR